MAGKKASAAAKPAKASKDRGKDALEVSESGLGGDDPFGFEDTLTLDLESTSLDGLDSSPNDDGSSEPLEGDPDATRILVVDDEPEILELVGPVLRDRGYLVLEAENGDEAIAAIEALRPHVVVLDVMMPGMSGWEVCRMVRSNPDLESVRIIMATGIGEQTNAATSPLYGADDALDKPFRLDALVQKVDNLVEKRFGAEALPAR